VLSGTRTSYIRQATISHIFSPGNRIGYLHGKGKKQNDV
jgi:DNA-binding transcriptional MocR family regulator